MHTITLPPYNPTGIATNVRKMDALSERQAVARLIGVCKNDLGLVKVLAAVELSRRAAAKLGA